MSRPPSTPPPKPPKPRKPRKTPEFSDEPRQSSEPPRTSVETAQKGLGLSNTQAVELIRAMRAVIVEVGCPEHVPRMDIVQDAFVTALKKPISERPPLSEWKRFVAWMMTLARFSTMTNRNRANRRGEVDEVSDEDIAADERLKEVLSEPEDVADPFVREALRKAFAKLDPEDQGILAAYYRENKTDREIGTEKGWGVSTAAERRHRALDRLRALLQAILAAIILLVTKNARASVTRLSRHVSRLVVQGTNVVGATSVTMACGALVPSSPMAEMTPRETIVAMPSARPTVAVAATVESSSESEVALVKPPVAPVKLIDVDMLAQRCSSGAMKTTKIASYVQGTVLPFAFLVAPVVTTIGCAGTEGQTPPPHVPEERDDETDPYEGACQSARAHGEKCISREQFDKIGTPSTTDP